MFAKMVPILVPADPPLTGAILGATADQLASGADCHGDFKS